MLCKNCGKNPATTHIKTIVNGKLTEYDLCSECAREMGYTCGEGNGGAVPEVRRVVCGDHRKRQDRLHGML